MECKKQELSSSAFHDVVALYNNIYLYIIWLSNWYLLNKYFSFQPSVFCHFMQHYSNASFRPSFCKLCLDKMWIIHLAKLEIQASLQWLQGRREMFTEKTQQKGACGRAPRNSFPMVAFISVLVVVVLELPTVLISSKRQRETSDMIISTPSHQNHVGLCTTKPICLSFRMEKTIPLPGCPEKLVNR